MAKKVKKEDKTNTKVEEKRNNLKKEIREKKQKKGILKIQ